MQKKKNYFCLHQYKFNQIKTKIFLKRLEYSCLYMRLSNLDFTFNLNLFSMQEKYSSCYILNYCEHSNKRGLPENNIIIILLYFLPFYSQ